MSVNPHIERLLRCIELEEKEQENRYRLDQQHSLKMLKAEGLAIHPLIITRKSFGYADYPEISFRLSFPAETGLFKDGAAIECFCSGEEPVKGVLLGFDGKSGECRLFAPDFPDWIEEDQVGIKLAPDSRTSEVQKNGLRDLPKHKRILALFEEWHSGNGPKPEKVMISDSNQPPGWQNPSLNESQRAAIDSILQNRPVTIVHGPPGTGKTTTLVEAIFQMAKRGEKMLVSAPSNAAVDHLCRGLIGAGVKILRIGNANKADASVYYHTPEGILSGSSHQKEIRQLRIRAEEFRRMALKYKRHFGKDEREQRKLLFQEVKSIRGEIKKIQQYQEEKLFSDATVIAGTPVALYEAGLQNKDFHCLVLDEAGQCLETLAWCIFPLAERMVLAGDPWQLPPTVLSREAVQLGFQRSILELAIDRAGPVRLLDTQYRMRSVIAGFSSSYFYNNLLHTAAHLHDTGAHLQFIDTAGSGFQESRGADGSSLQNEGELRLLNKLMEEEKPDLSKAAFISPYAGQVNAAKEMLPSGLRISTIDSFQGQEENTIFLSLVRSNEEGEIGFLKDYRRMNVAITRAKEQLFVTGDSATLGNDPFFQAFLAYVERHGQYRSVWEFDLL